MLKKIILSAGLCSLSVCVAQSQVFSENEEREFESACTRLADEYIAIMRDMRRLDSSSELTKRIEQLFSEDFVLIMRVGNVEITRANLFEGLRQASKEHPLVLMESERLVACSVKDRCFYIRYQIIDGEEERVYKAFEIVTSKNGIHIDKAEIFLG